MSMNFVTEQSILQNAGQCTHTVATAVATDVAAAAV